jgi:hypothetical protein
MQQNIFQKTIEDIERVKEITLVKKNFFLAEFDPVKLYSYFYSDTGILLQENDYNLLNYPEHSEIYWISNYSNNGISASGQINLENIQNAVSLSRNKYIIHNPDISLGQKEILENSYLFDTFPDFGWDTSTLIFHKKGNESIQLYFIDRIEIHKLDLSLSEYIEAALLCKGMYYWQYLFVSDISSISIPDYKKQYVDLILPFLEKTFPYNNYTEIKRRYHLLIK